MSAATWHTNMVSAARALLLTVIKATTGNISLAIVAGVLTRSTGSFLTDGFSPGDEIVAAGAGLGPVVANILAVDALTMTVDGPALADLGAAGGRSIVAGLPQEREWETERPSGGRPVIGRAYVADAYENLPSRPVGIGGYEEHAVLAIFTLEYPQSSGRRPISLMGGAIRSLFRPKAGAPSGLYYGGDSGTFMAASVGRLIPSANWTSHTVTARIVGNTES